MRKVLRFTVKQWKKFDIEKQEILTARYSVILSDYTTKRERTKAILKKFSKKNLDSALDSFNSGVDSFSRSMDSLSRELNGMAPKQDVRRAVWGSPEKATGPYRKRRAKTAGPDVREQFWGKGKTFTM